MLGITQRRLLPHINQVKFYSTKARPDLHNLLPKKKTFNRILFDYDSRLSYKKIIPILETVYKNLDAPENIMLPKYVKSYDLMVFKNVLATLRTTTNSINENLVDLENELVEQAAELGDSDAIAILAFETIEKRIKDKNSVSSEDFKYANDLIKELTAIKHPLVFKLGGDLAFKRGYHKQAEQYWLQFVELEPYTIEASHVYSNLGLYYFTYQSPTPDLARAKVYFEKSIKFGEIDKSTIQAHFYLGQLHVSTHPLTAKYHWEISAARGLKESFPSLGFLEMNVFQNYKKSIEWFKLGVEATNDVSCMIGQFDCYLKLDDYKSAFNTLTKLTSIHDQIKKIKSGSLKVPSMSKSIQDSMDVNESLLNLFFTTRELEIRQASSKIA